MLVIRPERPEERDALFQMYTAAFGQDQEAVLVNDLRANDGLLLSLVALSDGFVVGGVAFSAITLEPPVPRLRLAGLAPLGVRPAFQGQGIGSGLVQVGLQKCREIRLDAIFVVGEPNFYGRFGFNQTATALIDSEFPVPETHWLGLELRPEALTGVSGLARYRPEFQALS